MDILIRRCIAPSARRLQGKLQIPPPLVPSVTEVALIRPLDPGLFHLIALCRTDCVLGAVGAPVQGHGVEVRCG